MKDQNAPLWVATRDRGVGMCPGLSGGEAGSTTFELSLACVCVRVCCVLWMAGWVLLMDGSLRLLGILGAECWD